MLRCLFWNLQRRGLSQVVAEAAKSLSIDMFAVCETDDPRQVTLAELRKIASFHLTTGLISQRFHIFTRFPKAYVRVVEENDRFLILDMTLPARDRFLWMVLHGPSKRSGWNSTSIGIELTHHANSLRAAQARCNVAHALVVGDFNANPFDPALVTASAFNSVMDAREARKGYKTVQRKQYGYFYNPMWNLLGDHTPGPPASFFYDAHTQEELQWHMVDQVLISPSLIDYVDVSRIRLLDAIGPHQLITPQGRPQKKLFSDHLPLYFELKL
jgi:hypothetical protein